MKFILLLIPFFILGKLDGQCIGYWNNQIDLEALFMDPVKPFLPLGEQTQIQYGVSNNLAGTNSLYIPATDCVLNASWFEDILFGDINTFMVYETSYSPCNWEIIPETVVDGAFHIRNLENFPRDNYVYFQFTVTGIEVGGSIDNLVLNTSMSVASNCGDILLNSAVVGNIRVVQPLPITMKSFKVSEASCNQISLFWSTTFESNIAGYEIESSQNGRNFNKIGFVKSKNLGTSSVGNEYFFVDNTLNGKKGNFFYRLKIIDKNGTTSYSETITATTQCEDQKNIDIFPNPASSNLNVKLKGFNQLVERDIMIIDANGKVLETVHFGSNDYRILDISSYPPGVYYLKVVNDTEVAAKRVVKIR